MSKILYIEDNETIADGIKKYLQNEGILVETCSSLKEAKLKIKNQYDLILLDIVLSDGNGIEFYSFLKNKINLPIIEILKSCYFHIIVYYKSKKTVLQILLY